MNARIYIVNLKDIPEVMVTISGWIVTVRDQKKVQFIVLQDESGMVQLVNPAVRDDENSNCLDAALLTKNISNLTPGTFVTVFGKDKESDATDASANTSAKALVDILQTYY